MKTYHMTVDDIRRYGFNEMPPGPIRLGNTTEVKNIQDADAVVCPLPFRETDYLTPQLLHKILKDFNIQEERLVCFDCSDFEAQTSEHPNCMFVRSNLKGWMDRLMPRSIAWPWPTENYKECMPIPEGGFKYDVSGWMWISGGCRKNACESVIAEFGPRADVQMFKDFTGYIFDAPEGLRRRKEFRRSMHESRISLCPSSIHGVLPYRVTEAMAAARVAFMFCDDYCLPWTSHINWDDCIVQYGVQDTINAGRIIKEWLSKHSDAEIVERGLLARKAWETWLDRDKWTALFTIAVQERLEKDGLLKA